MRLVEEKGWIVREYMQNGAVPISIGWQDGRLTMDAWRRRLISLSGINKAEPEPGSRVHAGRENHVGIPDRVIKVWNLMSCRKLRKSLTEIEVLSAQQATMLESCRV